MSGWTHLADTKPTSRKHRPCFLCGSLIAVGEKYVRRVGVEDREFVSMSMHVECEAETRDWDETGWETFSPGDLETRTRESR